MSRRWKKWIFPTIYESIVYFMLRGGGTMVYYCSAPYNNILSCRKCTRLIVAEKISLVHSFQSAPVAERSISNTFTVSQSPSHLSLCVSPSLETFLMWEKKKTHQKCYNKVLY
jgi:hypothetical protein